MISYIYLVTNTLDDKQYVGKTKNPIIKRFRSHYNSARAGSTQKFHAAIRKHGFENFVIEELEITTCQEADTREKYFITLLRPAYNMTTGGEGHKTGLGSKGVRSFVPSKCITDGENLRRVPIDEPLPEGFTLGMPKRIKTYMSESRTGIKASIITREKMSKSHIGHIHSEESKIKMSASQVGRVLSEESKIKMSNAKKGRKLSDETKAKMSAAKLGKQKSQETKDRMSAARQQRSSKSLPVLAISSKP